MHLAHPGPNILISVTPELFADDLSPQQQDVSGFSGSSIIRLLPHEHEQGFGENNEAQNPFLEIMSYNIMATPAVVVDGTVKIKGHVPSESEVKQLLGI